jgi:porphyrinogen peroxidase
LLADTVPMYFDPKPLSERLSGGRPAQQTSRRESPQVVTAQVGIFAVGTLAHSFLEFTIRTDTTPLELVRAAADVQESHTTVGGVNIVLGVRPSIWAQVAADQVPEHTADFSAALIGPDGFTMPATQQDAWIWVAGAGHDLVFDVATDIVAILRPVAEPATEVTGWSYRHSRDLTGFEDGTENPPLSRAADVAVVLAGRPGEGSSVVLAQQWVHKATDWNSLDVPTQENVIGRTKADSVELDEIIQPAESHVARTSIQNQDGADLEIFRRNVPYGTVTEHGTMFVGFTSDPPRMNRMLQRMVGSEDGIRDALTRYATPLTGAYYVVPATEALRTFASPADE